MSFPKKIFQTWKERNVDKYVFLSRWQRSWRELNPTYEYVLWTDEDNRKFIEQRFPEFLTIYDTYKENIKRVDAVRYFYLYEFGGIYADIDFECLKPFDNILALGFDVILGQLGPMDNSHFELHQIPNALMISKPGQDFWKCVIEVMINASSSTRSDITPEYITGPCLLTLCYCFYSKKGIYSTELISSIYGKDIFEGVADKINFSSSIGIAPPDMFYPYNWDNKTHVDKYKTARLSHDQAKLEFPNSYAVTYWMHSWE